MIINRSCWIPGRRVQWTTRRGWRRRRRWSSAASCSRGHPDDEALRVAERGEHLVRDAPVARRGHVAAVRLAGPLDGQVADVAAAADVHDVQQEPVVVALHVEPVRPRGLTTVFEIVNMGRPD